MTDTLTIEITHEEREAIWAGLNLYIDALNMIPANRDGEQVQAARALFVKISNAEWTEGAADREALQHAVDAACGALMSSQYVDGPSERDAWRTAVAELSKVATQHKGQAVVFASRETETP